LIDLTSHESVLHPYQGEYKGEFADLTEGQPGDEGRPQRQSFEEHRQESRRRLQQDHPQDQQADDDRLGKHHFDIEEHADGYEEKA